MVRKVYGSLCNRMAEGKNYKENKTIEVGDDITMYYWSDRNCYYVTEVVDQKHIFVKEYEVVADRSKPGGMGHQNWLYFKSRKEANIYMNDHISEAHLKAYGKYPVEDIKETPAEEWVFRYGKWNRVVGVDDNGKKIYRHLQANISFGVRDYYYDWEF